MFTGWTESEPSYHSYSWPSFSLATLILIALEKNYLGLDLEVTIFMSREYGASKWPGSIPAPHMIP